jgi:hypothetical protein
MKRCLKFGVGGCEKIREKFPKMTFSDPRAAVQQNMLDFNR